MCQFPDLLVCVPLHWDCPNVRKVSYILYNINVIKGNCTEIQQTSNVGESYVNRLTMGLPCDSLGTRNICQNAIHRIPELIFLYLFTALCGKFYYPLLRIDILYVEQNIPQITRANAIWIPQLVFQRSKGTWKYRQRHEGWLSIINTEEVM